MGCSEVEVLLEVELAVGVPLTAGVGRSEPFSTVTEEGDGDPGKEMREALATAMVVATFSISPLRLLV